MSQGYAIAVVDPPIAHIANVRQALEAASCAVEAAARDPEIVEEVLESPEMLGVNTVTAESVMLRVVARTRPGRQWTVQRRLTRAALTAFGEAGIDAPLAVFTPAAIDA